MSLKFDAEYSLAKEEQPDTCFLYSHPSSAMGTIMYVHSKSTTTPLFRVSQPGLLSSRARYTIIEDFGPGHIVRNDWLGSMLIFLPVFLSYVTVGLFNCTFLLSVYPVGSLSYAASTVLTLVNYWRMKRKGIDSDILELHSPVQTRKLLLMAVINMLFAIYGLHSNIINLIGIDNEWSALTSLAENIASLQIVITKARSDVPADINASLTMEAITAPLLAFYHFAWFGLGEEARKAYVEALLKLGRPISATLRAHWPHLSTPTFSWSATAPPRAKFRQGLANVLSLVLPNAPHITPYTSSVLPDDRAALPASPIRIQPPNTVGDRTDAKRQGRVTSREPVRRLSLHKPALAALNPANAIQSVLDVPLRRLSHHKPSFVPLAPPNGPVITTLHASGSNPPSVEAATNTRRQEKFASRPSTRGLSYHKPAFVPLAPANANGAVPNTSAPTIPLVEIPRDIIGERNVVLRAESIVDDRMAPPPFSTISTAPPPFPTPSTATPAPPYRDVNPFLNPVP
jgi:Pheromone A receptor